MARTQQLQLRPTASLRHKTWGAVTGGKYIFDRREDSGRCSVDARDVPGLLGSGLFLTVRSSGEGESEDPRRAIVERFADYVDGLSDEAVSEMLAAEGFDAPPEPKPTPKPEPRPVESRPEPDPPRPAPSTPREAAPRGGSKSASKTTKTTAKPSPKPTRSPSLADLART